MSLHISMNLGSYRNGFTGLSEEAEKFSACNCSHVPFLLLENQLSILLTPLITCSFVYPTLSYIFKINNII